MPDDIAAASAAAMGTLGVWISPGRGTAIPELIGMMDQVFRERVAKLPWVPADWYSQVSALQDQDRANLIQIAPALSHGSNLANVPTWVGDDAGHREAWQKIFERCDEIVSNYARGMADAGKAQWEAALADSAFWSSPLMSAAIAVQSTLAAIPGAVGDAAGTLIGDLFGGFLKKAWWVLALVIIGYVLYVNRGKAAAAAPGLVKKVAKKVAKVVKAPEAAPS